MQVFEKKKVKRIVTLRWDKERAEAPQFDHSSVFDSSFDFLFFFFFFFFAESFTSSWSSSLAGCLLGFHSGNSSKQFVSGSSAQIGLLTISFYLQWDPRMRPKLTLYCDLHFNNLFRQRYSRMSSFVPSLMYHSSMLSSASSSNWKKFTSCKTGKGAERHDTVPPEQTRLKLEY